MTEASSGAETALSAWRVLCARVDARFAEVFDRYGAQMQCAAGCSLCCQQQLSVCALEAVAMVRALEAVGTIHGSPLNTVSCALLSDDRCTLYEHRPLICRSHGLPIAQRDAAALADQLGGVQVGESEQTSRSVSVCQLNFKQQIPADGIIDGAAIDATLAVADHLLRAEFDLPAMRVPIAELAARGREALPDALHGLLAAKIGAQSRDDPSDLEPPQGGSGH